ncbi:MAG: restriction endonuclease subunit S [Treponema sp.]|jgi:hypothetical protein|nr:restriction endonuclease subunit S [Treponema sp.]
MNSRLLSVQLGDITQRHDEQRIALSPRQCAARPGDYPYYGPQGIMARIDSYAYEGDYLLITGAPPGVPSGAPQAGPRAVLARGRFSANTHVHVFSCDPDVEPGFLCRLLNGRSFSSPVRFGPEDLETLELTLPSLEVQRQMLAALSGIEGKMTLLQDQNRVLTGMIHALFDLYFIFGRGSLRPLGELVEYRDASLGPAPGGSVGAGGKEVPEGPVGEGTEVLAGTAFYNIILYPRGDLHPLFVKALVKNPDFLAYAETCMEGRAGKRRINGERLMAFELNSPGQTVPLDHKKPRRSRKTDVYREFSRFAGAGEQKLAGNRAELRVLEELRQSLTFSPV